MGMRLIGSRRTAFLTLAIASIAVLFAACARDGQGSEGSAAASEVRVVASEWKFEPQQLQLPVGKPVKIVLENKGMVLHDIAIKELNFKLEAGAGQTTEKTLTVKKAGDYRLICSLPGHAESGMVGSMTAGEGTPAVAHPDGASGQPGAATRDGQAVSAQSPAAKPALNVGPLPPPQMAAPIGNRGPAELKFTVETKEVSAVMDDGVTYNYWTFGGTVPGPLLRARQGDTVELTLKNLPDSLVTHSIDLHAVTGPGGGAKATQVEPGKDATFRFQALNPGVYVYHCATPMIPHHISSGMYGLIVIEPPGGLAPVDREFYVMEGDFYLQGPRGTKGHREFSVEKMLAEQPDYVLFNGRVGALAKDGALKAKTGESIRIFFGVGGPNLISSFHVIGEIFDKVYAEGASEAVTNVQTTVVPAGGATMVEFRVDVPGSYILVDHSLTRLEKGGAGFLEVEGPQNPVVFQEIRSGTGAASGH